MLIIGLCGYRGAGKTTLAKHYHSECNYWDTTVLGFSDIIVSMLVTLGIDHTIAYDKARWNDPIEWAGGRTMRELADTLGTNWGRDMVDPELWCNVMEKRIQFAVKHGRDIVFADGVRRINEAEMIKRVAKELCATSVMLAIVRPDTDPAMACDVAPVEGEVTTIRSLKCGVAMFNEGPIERVHEHFKRYVDRFADNALTDGIA